MADCDLAERQIFKAFEKYRYGVNREFFALKLKDAIPVVMQTVSQINFEAQERRRAKEQFIAEARARTEELSKFEVETQTRVEEQVETEVDVDVDERLEAEAPYRVEEQSDKKKQKNFSKYGIQVTNNELIVGDDSYDLNEIRFAEIITTRPRRSALSQIILAPFRIGFWFLLVACAAAVVLTIPASGEDVGPILSGAAIVLLVSWLILRFMDYITQRPEIYTLMLHTETGTSLILLKTK